MKPILQLFMVLLTIILPTAAFAAEPTEDEQAIMSQAWTALQKASALLNIPADNNRNTGKANLHKYYAAVIAIQTYGAPKDFRDAFKAYSAATEQYMLAMDEISTTDGQRFEDALNDANTGKIGGSESEKKKKSAAALRELKEAQKELEGIARKYHVTARKE